MTKLSYNELIEKLKLAKEQAPKNLDFFLDPEENFDLNMFEVKLFDSTFNHPRLSGIGEMSMPERLGIKTESFPAPEDLEEDELKTIVEMILDIWDQYHFVADFPDGLPYRIAYIALISVWEEKVMCFATGHFHFDFIEMDLDQYVKTKTPREEMPF